jgi:hypothetical protein
METAVRCLVRIGCIVIAAAAFAAAGCSGDASVSGNVTLDGQPLRTGTVTFHPAGHGPVAYGQVGSDGGYRLTVGSAGGVPPGEYRVTVVANEDPAPPPKPSVAPTPGKRITPARYADPKTTELTFTVKPGGNTIHLPLKSK